VKSSIVVAALAAALVSATPAFASFPCGIYARVVKVEVGPTEDKPEWVKVYGDFLLVKTSGRVSEPVVRGYMYFSIVADKAQLCRLEWNDLKKLAGSEKSFIAFGSAHAERRDDFAKEGSPNVHTNHNDSVKPIPYPLNHGLTRLRTDYPEDSHSPVLKLMEYQRQNPLKK
jgi:hypothetical protein